MVATIGQLIGKVNPQLYADNWNADLPADKITEKPISEHKIVYDSSSETLEPIYFFILDLMNSSGLATEKLMDNFASSPGSGHFAELGQRASIMQQQGSKLLGDVNSVLRSVLNLIYDLKEFKIRLAQYDSLKTDKKDAAILGLKQIWMDKVDIQKGNSSIKAMSMQGGFQTLIDAFLFVKNEKEVEKVDLNDRVKRIISARIQEFNDWLTNSEDELRKRYELEKNYLRSQVNALKMYSRWAKPYLRAAQELEMTQMNREPALVKAFNTLILELTLMGKKKIKVPDEVLSGNLPKEVEKMKNRDYYSCVLVNFKFRGIPQRVNQQSHYVFGGRAEMSFKSYVLTGDEIAKLNEEIDASDVGDALKLIEGATGESLDLMQKEIDFFLEEKSQEEKKKGNSDDGSNPFKALFGGYNSEGSSGDGGKKPEKKKVGKPEPESYAEKEYIRPLAKKNVQEINFRLFDLYKKTHGMASYT